MGDVYLIAGLGVWLGFEKFLYILLYLIDHRHILLFNQLIKKVKTLKYHMDLHWEFHL